MEEITDICDSDQRPIKALPIAAASTDSALAVPKVGSAVKKKRPGDETEIVEARAAGNVIDQGKNASSSASMTHQLKL